MPTVTFYKDGETVSREEILRLEVRRARYMMSLLLRKLGAAGLVDLFAAEIEQADQLEHSWTEGSGNGFRASVATARVSEGNAAEFVQWFVAGYMGPNAPAMMRAHPEHLGDGMVRPPTVPRLK